jgi:hypothetical protein
MAITKSQRKAIRIISFKPYFICCFFTALSGYDFIFWIIRRSDVFTRDAKSARKDLYSRKLFYFNAVQRIIIDEDFF